jgi:hypothetical protein
LDNELNLEYRRVKTIDEGIEIGEAKPSQDYHILIRKKRKILVTHLFWQKCEFCHLEDDTGIVDLNEPV